MALLSVTANGGHSLELPPTLECVECGGEAHRLPFPEGTELAPGAVVPFVCEDCHHRHDIVIDGVDEDP